MRLQRITTSGRWIPEIDALRFVPICAVIVVHGMGPLLTDARFRARLVGQYPIFISEVYHLNRGVQLFFVISGFILAQPFVRQYLDGGSRVSLKAFYLRRVTRLEPPYILSLLLYSAAIVLFRAGRHSNVGLSLLSSLGYVHNFFGWLEPINNATWSLEVEIQFYLLAPLISMIYLVRPTWARRSVLVGSIVLFGVLPTAHLDRAGFYLAANISFFLVGYLLADLRVHQMTRGAGPWWDVCGLLLWPTLLLLPDRASPVLLGFILLLCFASAFLGPVSRHLMRTRWIAIIGGMCYSIYLLHDLVIEGLYPLLKRALIFHSVLANYALHLTLLIGPVLAVSTVYFILVERPCMDPQWPRKLMDAVRGKAVVLGDGVR